MTFDAYQVAAARTAKAEPHLERVLVQTCGLSGEVGEIADMVKKWAWHGKELDPTRMADELGDVLWYVADLASACGLSLSAVAAGNVAKLERRYPSGFVVGGGVR